MPFFFLIFIFYSLNKAKRDGDNLLCDGSKAILFGRGDMRGGANDDGFSSDSDGDGVELAELQTSSCSAEQTKKKRRWCFFFF